MKKHTHTHIHTRKKIPLQSDKFGNQAILLHVLNKHGLSMQLCIQLSYLTAISLTAFLQDRIWISSRCSWAARMAMSTEQTIGTSCYYRNCRSTFNFKDESFSGTIVDCCLLGTLSAFVKNMSVMNMMHSLLYEKTWLAGEPTCENRTLGYFLECSFRREIH
jgi:hypothetical protein